MKQCQQYSSSDLIYIIQVYQSSLSHMDSTPPSKHSKGEKGHLKRDPYHKIPLKFKLFFYQQVLLENANLREIAKIIGIKYSTAKTLERNYKGLAELQNEQLMQDIRMSFLNKQKVKRRCSYRQIQPQQARQVESQGYCCGIKHIHNPNIEIISASLQKQH